MADEQWMWIVDVRCGSKVKVMGQREGRYLPDLDTEVKLPAGKVQVSQEETR